MKNRVIRRRDVGVQFGKGEGGREGGGAEVRPAGSYGDFLTLRLAKGLMRLEGWRFVTEAAMGLLGAARNGRRTARGLGRAMREGGAHHRHGVLFHVCTAKSADGE